jgi:signal transduction histidine kinase
MTFRFEKKDMVTELKVATNEAQEVYDNPVHFSTKLDSAPVVCDHMSILRVVENLISNGVKYGSVETPISLTLKQNENEIEISVHNEGSYIEPDEQNSMFDFLTRHTGGRDQQREGWGLGLYLVRLVAKAHKGRAWIESDQATGTTFCIAIKNEAHPPGSAFSEYM